MPSYDAVIVGGGIAGLAAAYELSQGQNSFVVLERAARVGGVIISEAIEGFNVDGGPDALLIQKPAAIKLCEELGLGDRLVVTKPPRLAYIQRGGRLHALPASSVLGIPTRIAAGMAYLDGKFYYHAWPEVQLGDWVAVDPTFGQFPADAAHLRFVVGGITRQTELLRLMGALHIDVLSVGGTLRIPVSER